MSFRTYLIAFGLLYHSLISLAENKTVRIGLDWELGYSKDSVTMPSKWIPSVVPGAVQLDIARAEKYQPFYYAGHWKDYLWMEDRYFTYRTSFKKPELSEGKQLHFVSLGIDYEFDIIFNGEKVFHQEGMFTPVDIDLTAKLKDKNQLLVKVYPVPKLHALPADRTQASQVTKPAVSYGWDWHPRLVPLGIWDSTCLEIQSIAHVDDLHVDYKINNDLTEADIDLGIKGKNLKGTQFMWILSDASGKEVLRSEGKIDVDHLSKALVLAKPNLWWTHDQGTPYLYTYEFKLSDQSGRILQSITSRTGFRRVRLVMNEGAWDEPKGFPKTRSVPPMQMELNGRKIFCKGTNWVNPEVFPGIITRTRYNELIDFAREANFNILRVWGGGIVNKESFFELCDEKGILVWQEFPLACNNYEGTPHYLKILEQEATAIIRRLKKHPSLALWCGGNELFNNWSLMTDQSSALRLLNSLCYQLDPDTPFNPTSPMMGMGHGHYVFRDWSTGEEVLQEMVRSKFTAYTEFGMPAPASVEILKKIIPPEELWPPRPGTSWESHHAYNAWIGNTWLCQDIIEYYFGPSNSLEQLVANGQLMQGEGYKCIYEEARRQKPYCSMAANWCYNEPWPTAANNSLISYPNIPKPGFYAVKNACRPVLASARIPKFRWKADEIFTAEIWMLNDLPQDVAAGKVTVRLSDGKNQIKILDWNYIGMESNKNQQGPNIHYRLPAWQSDRFKLILEVENHPEYNSEYTLAFTQ
jgi:beta-mannosidase